MTTNHPTFFDRQLLSDELAAAESSLAHWLDAVSHWTTPTGMSDELYLEHALQEVRYYATTVRTVNRLLQAMLE